MDCERISINTVYSAIRKSSRTTKRYRAFKIRVEKYLRIDFKMDCQSIKKLALDRLKRNLGVFKVRILKTDTSVKDPMYNAYEEYLQYLSLHL